MGKINATITISNHNQSADLAVKKSCLQISPSLFRSHRRAVRHDNYNAHAWPWLPSAVPISGALVM